ncbi:unnamed protein product [marine sediment metagenome]|uniref:Uncharacterized protein n=1 Tax=marine sediment metagenome TaxID=412755 RepID=X1BYL2_9ZZZZ
MVDMDVMIKAEEVNKEYRREGAIIRALIDIKNEDYFIDVIFHTENYRLRLTIEDFLEYKDFIDIGIFGDISKNYDPNDIEKILNTLNS